MDSKAIQLRLGENLKTIRKTRGMTQFALAERANVSEDTIKSIELSRSWPSEKTLAQISEALGIDIYHLFLPTVTTLDTNEEIAAKLRETVTQSYLEFVESAVKKLKEK